jgi:bifunctional DNA-binding transcriptional regulator/antitoxin component of YhaV-PrlF toxin-antitoxin module
MIVKEVVASVTRKGQVTVPVVEVRRHLGIGVKDKIAFQSDEDGEVRVKKVKYPTIASLRGAAGCLKQPKSWEEIEQSAREERVEAILRDQ